MTQHDPLIAFADKLSGTIAIAAALARSGREVDLAGLENGIGLLCAKALDRGAGCDDALRQRLVELREEIDRLLAVLRERRPA